MGRVTSRMPVQRIDVSDPDHPQVVQRPDTLVVEEPLEIRVGGTSIAVTMRTPGDDFDLTLGFLLTEDLIGGARDVDRLMHCLDEGDDGRPTFNAVDVTLAEGVAVPGPGSARALYTSSACGVCGKASIDQVMQQRRGATAGSRRAAVANDRGQISPSLLVTLPTALRAHQKVFDRTGGLHAAGLFTLAGELLAVREDVGRHNAVDKVIGWAAREELIPLSGHVLVVSGRASFELTQKALMAGIPILAAVSAPSTLAAELAREAGMTLAGFVRDPSLSVYAGSERLSGLPPT